MREFKNLKIGKTFKLGNNTLKVCKHINCDECFINKSNLFNSCADLAAFDIIPDCIAQSREDKTDVMFIKVETMEEK